MKRAFSLLALALACPCLGFDFDRDPLLAPSTNVVFQAASDGYAGFRGPSLVCSTNGTLVAICEGLKGGTGENCDLVFKRSTDAGTNWSALGILQHKDSATAGHPRAILDRQTDRIWLTFTGDKGTVRVTHSDDAGTTWAKPKEITANDLPFPQCPDASLVRFDGNDRLKREIMLSTRNEKPEKPDALAVRLSYDRGKTWAVTKPLSADPTGESCLASLPGVAIGCLFECGDSRPHGRIVFSRFNLHWLETIESTALPPAGIILFDGKAMGHWRKGDYRGQEAEVRIDDGSIVMERGNDMTGITWGGPITRMNYEICFEARRLDGSDFFCGFTFPVGENPCTLVLGGWGGSLVGLSCLDYEDAANNETGLSMNFEDKRWYNVRLRVTKSAIEVWIDGEQVIDVEITNRRIGIRFEVEPSRPLGVATWRTTGAIRDIRLFPVTPLDE